MQITRDDFKVTAPEVYVKSPLKILFLGVSFSRSHMANLWQKSKLPWRLIGCCNIGDRSTFLTNFSPIQGCYAEVHNTQKKNGSYTKTHHIFFYLPWPESNHIAGWASPMTLIQPSVVQTMQSPHSHSLTVPSTGDIYTACVHSTTRIFNRTNALSLWYSQKAKRGENRNVLFFPYAAFVHLFLCGVSLSYIHIVKCSNGLFLPSLSRVFQRFFFLFSPLFHSKSSF